MNNELNPQVQVIDLASITADGDVYGIYLPKKARILNVKLINGANIAQSNTDKAVIALKNGSTVIAQHSTALTGGTGPITANTLTSVPIVSGAEDVAAGSLLNVNYDESGTYAMTNAKVFVEYFFY